ncbi:peptidyl-prolyl cis-trans isomerase CYP21-1-like [Cucumis melo]|uniref:Peptidyl-prolyl cis-trans isomerase n=1 Tax=Cucumis melo TaxID=3656 RepID=A0ABM3L662_CUCME|nr:peptidyl-prolyl cis-trans isomerase CYP21-1-like [Cucumis melo]
MMPPSLDRLSHFPCFHALHSQSSMFSSLLRIPIPDFVSDLIADNLTINENFRALCTGEKGKTTSGKALHYKGTPFHRIVSSFVIQGGDILYGDGKGYGSIYGGTFAYENFRIKHSHAGPDSNGSQFFITTIKSSWLDGEHIVFGKVIQGMDYVYAIEGGAGTYSGKPRKKVTIANSREIPKSK